VNHNVMDRLHDLLAQLTLSQADTLLESLLERAAAEQPAYADFLLGVLETEKEFRTNRILLTRTRMANLPFAKTLSQFDFAFQPSVDERQIKDLQTLRFLSEAGNVILLGPPGVGKTHLAVGLAIEAIRGGNSAYFMTANHLVNDLGKAAREGKLDQRMRLYLRPKVLIVDEVGYLPLDPIGATIFFQLVSARYERGSIILTSNKSYTDWGAVFGEQTIAAAILDRLLHHSTTINIRGESYRLKERKRAGLFASVPPASLEATPKRHVTHEQAVHAVGEVAHASGA
jgi:DNA replication protein DnaC